MTDINVGAITEALNNKVDLPTPSTPQDAVDYVVEKQDPTSANSYTWYKKYKSGWVEQGGYIAVRGQQNNTITLPVEMADTNYVVLTDVVGNIGYGALNWQISPITTTGFRCFYDGDSSDPTEFSWQVSGMAA